MQVPKKIKSGILGLGSLVSLFKVFSKALITQISTLCVEIQQEDCWQSDTMTNALEFSDTLVTLISKSSKCTQVTVLMLRESDSPINIWSV